MSRRKRRFNWILTLFVIITLVTTPFVQAMTQTRTTDESFALPPQAPPPGRNGLGLGLTENGNPADTPVQTIDGINVTNGNLLLADTHFQFNGVGPTFGFQIYYNSQADPGTSAAPIGRKWTHNLNEFLEPIPNGSLRLHQADGGTVDYALTCRPDVNRSGGLIDILDIQADAEHWQTAPQGDPLYGPYFDVDVDGDVDSRDIGLVTAAFQRTCSEVDPAHTYWTGYNADGITSRLVNDPAGPQLQTRDGLIHQFNPLSAPVAPGRLTGLHDRSGNGYTLSYGVSGRLDAAGSSSGAQLTFAYNPDGTIQSVQDHSGRVVTYQYDNNGNLTGVQRYGLPWHTYGYAANNLLVSDTDANGAITNYQHDGVGRTIVLQRPGSVTPQTYNYASPGQAVVTDPLGRATEVLYDPTTSRVARVSNNASGMVVLYAYDTRGNLAHLGGGDGNDYEYDVRGNLLRIESADPDPLATQRLETLFTYDACNNQVTITDALGAVTQNVYDAATCHLQETHDPLGNATIFINNTRGQPLQITDALGRTTTNAYDSRGNLVQTTDAAGNVTTMAYDALNRKTGETGPPSSSTAFQYDSFDRQTRIQAPAGAATGMTYDALGNLLQATDPDGRTTTYAYDGRGNKIGVTDALGHVTTYEYDAADRLVRTIDAAGKMTTVQYDGQDRPVQVSGPLGQVTQLAYDDANRTRIITDTLGHPTTFVLDRLGRVTDVTGSEGLSNHYTYDVAGRLLAVTDPLSRTETFEYDAGGRKVGETDALGHTTQYLYDTVGNVSTLTNARGDATTFQYDQGDRMTQVRDPLGGVTRMAYDARGNTTVVTDTVGHASSFAYDAGGHMTGVTNGAGQTTALEYSAAGRPTALVAPLGGRVEFVLDPLGRVLQQHEGSHTTSFTYDTQGNRTGMTDANGAAWRYIYDDLGRLVSASDPLSRTTGYGYDLLGNLTNKSQPDGTTIEYLYDALNRIVRTNYSDGSYETQTYDAAGNVTQSASFGPGGLPVSQTGFSYDARNRVVQTVQQIAPTFTASINYQYDAVGNPISKTYNFPSLPSPGHTTLIWDAKNRLTSLVRSDNGGALTTSEQRSYDLEGHLLQSTLQTSANPTAGTVVLRTYSVAGRVTSIRNCTNPACTTQLSRFDYTYDANGNRTSEHVFKGSTEWTIGYAYDAYNRLSRETRQPVNPPGPPSYDYWYTYDNVGNRMQRENRANPCTPGSTCPRTDTFYDSAGQTQLQQTSAGGPPTQVIQYQYDARGNLVQRQAVVGEPLLEQFGYTPGGQQASYNNPIANESRQYTYDALGNRILECGSAAPGCRGYLYDGPNRVAEYNDALGSPTLAATYLTDQQIDGQVARIDPSNLTVDFFLKDALGSTRQIVDQVQSVVNDYEYTAFGETFRALTGLSNDLLFTGRPRDAASGLYDMRTRTYDPLSGRFLQTDPIYQGLILSPCVACWQHPLELVSVMPLYAYSGNNPATYTDPTGEMWWFWYPWWYLSGPWYYTPYSWWGWWYGPWGWFGLRWWWWRWWWPANPWWGGWWWWQWRWWWGGWWLGWWGNIWWPWWWFGQPWWWWPWWFGWGWWYSPWWWGGWWWPWWWFKWRGWWHWWWRWPLKWTWWCGWWWRWWWPWWWGGFWWPWWWLSWGGWGLPWWLGWGWWWWPWWWGGYWWPWWFGWGWWPWWGGHWWWPWWWPWRAWWWGTWWWGAWYWWTGWYWWPWWWGGFWWPWWWYCNWSLRPWWFGLSWIWWGWWRPWWPWWWWRSWWWWPSRGWWWYPLVAYGGVALGDLGDTPDSSNHYGSSMTAYTGPPVVTALYPTVHDPALGPPYGPLHRYPYADAWLGTYVTVEADADLLPDADGYINIDPPANFSNRDERDDGVNPADIILVNCNTTSFAYVLNVRSVGVRTRYVNVWIDWNRDGDWDDVLVCPNGVAVPEWAVQNQTSTLSRGVYNLLTPGFTVWDPLDRAHWMRISLTEQPYAAGAAGAGPAAGFLYGETEDYVIN